MVTYKLIKIYPQCPLKLNDTISPENSYSGCKGTYDWIIDNPELAKEFWQEVKELSLLEEAKLRYPVGTKIISVLGTTGVIKDDLRFGYRHKDSIFTNDGSLEIYDKGVWAEIVDDFVLPEKWCIKQNTAKEVCDWFNKNGTTFANIHGSWTYLNYPYIDGYYSSEIKSGCTEITFEQFKKYVLKEETTVKVKEKVVEKDYEILSLSFTNNFCYLQKNGEYAYRNTPNTTSTLKNCLRVGWKIHSVKRLSDGEIFTIGDKCSPIGKYKDNIHSITKIWFCNPGYLRLSSNNYTLGIKDIQKVKIPLFTSEDDVDIFEGDKFYTVDSNFEIQSIFGGEDEVDNAWSSKEKAEEYILMNKPSLSLSDVWDNLKVKDQKEVMKFVKSKLNKNG